jgi:ribonuclease J
MQNKLKIISLGGVAVNKNMYVYETEKDIVVVDCGIAFPTEDMPGIDLIIPDVSYLKGKEKKIRGIFLTHGHEDHRGALPYILPQLPKVPVYGTKLTLGLSKVRTDESRLTVDWRETKYSEVVNVGDFSVEFVHVTHSIPDASFLIIRTPQGIIAHAADYKFDWTPVDGFPTDVQRIAQIGKEGILCLMTDCLRVEKPGYTLSEKRIEETFNQQVQKVPGKVIITTQSSNISRIQQAVDVAKIYNRKIVFAGRSIEQNVEVAVKLGYLSMTPDMVIRWDEIAKYPANAIMVLATGSQGQDNSALSRIANGEHKIKIADGDYVIFSQDPIPGSESAVNDLINSLIKGGAEVFYSEILDDLHVSGHEAADGLRLMLALTRPKFVWPIGGTVRHLKHYARLANGMGYKNENIILIEDGETVDFENEKWKKGEKVAVKNILIDGLGIGDVGTVVLRDRRTMAADGIVLVVIPIEKATGEMVGDVDIVSRGFVYMKESDELIGEAKEVVRKALSDHQREMTNFGYLRRLITDELEKFFFASTRRRPLILPTVMEI